MRFYPSAVVIASFQLAKTPLLPSATVLPLRKPEDIDPVYHMSLNDKQFIANFDCKNIVYMAYLPVCLTNHNMLSYTL